MLDDRELLGRIERGESDRVEFTTAKRELDKLRQAICAFANDLPGNREPGLLFVGLEDDGSCGDLTIDDDLLKTLGGLRNDGKIQPFPGMEVARKRLRDCDLAVIQVEPSDNPPLKVDGRCWIRSGPRRARATAEEERRLTEKRRWGSLSWDLHGVARATVAADLDMRAFENEYLPSAVSPEVLAENQRDLEAQLQALRLAAPDGAPTATAVLMLGRDPLYWFPGAYLQFVRYAGAAVTDPILDHAEISGPLPQQLREADRLLRLNIRQALDTRGERHVDQRSYPWVALRELLRNAVIHRNYESSHTPVRISWFVDRVEILSPGVTAYRNPTIAEAMRNLGFMQRFGIGIETARRALAENGNPPPEFDVQEAFVHVTVRRRP